jgi:hypothetical protein
MNEYDKGYDEGFKQGLAASEFTDGYWLRCYAGQAMQAIISELSFVYGSSKSPDDLIPQYEKIAVLAVNQAKALLDEVKKHES